MSRERRLHLGFLRSRTQQQRLFCSPRVLWWGRLWGGERRGVPRSAEEVQPNERYGLLPVLREAATLLADDIIVDMIRWRRLAQRSPRTGSTNEKRHEGGKSSNMTSVKKVCHHSIPTVVSAGPTVTVKQQRPFRAHGLCTSHQSHRPGFPQTHDLPLLRRAEASITMTTPCSSHTVGADSTRIVPQCGALERHDNSSMPNESTSSLPKMIYFGPQRTTARGPFDAATYRVDQIRADGKKEQLYNDGNRTTKPVHNPDTVETIHFPRPLCPMAPSSCTCSSTFPTYTGPLPKLKRVY
jgi:hypothetical protein